MQFTNLTGYRNSKMTKIIKRCRDEAFPAALFENGVKKIKKDVNNLLHLPIYLLSGRIYNVK